jgi:hypothetical protein
MGDNGSLLVMANKRHMVIDLLFQYKIKEKNPAGATADKGATSIAMETVNCSNGDQINQVIA